MSTENIIPFQIKGIELLESHIYDNNKEGSGEQSYTFEVQLEQSSNISKDLIFITVKINVNLGENESEILGSIKATIAYEILQLENFTKKGMLNLPELLEETLNSVSISTVRGICFSQFRGTYLHSAIFPVINPKSLKKQ